MDRPKRTPPNTFESTSSSSRPIAPSRPEEPTNNSGRVTFDDRGQAVWEWSVSTGRFGTKVSTARLKKLEYAGLSLADDGVPAGKAPANVPSGKVGGYDPYDRDPANAAKVAKREPPPKGGPRDLRKLDEWIKLRKRAAANKDS